MGSVFSKLVRSGIASPDGTTKFYDNPAKALAAASAKTAMPGTSALEGTIGQPQVSPAPMADAGDVVPGVDNTSSKFIAPPESAQPKIVQPSFAEATSGGTNPFSKELTKKGTALSLLLTAMEGASRGMAASVPINGGHTSVGLGPALAAGFDTIPEMKARQNALAQQELEQQKEKAQIAALPAQTALQRALTQSEIDKNNATTNRKDLITVPGVGLVDSTGRTIVPEPDAEEKANAAIEARLKQAKAAGLDPEQTAQFVYGIKPGRDPVASNAAADEAYRDIVKKQALGQPLSVDEKATKIAYEKQKLLVPNSTMTLRMDGLAQMREYPVINKKTGELEMQNAKTINANPGAYAPAGEGAKSMNKLALIEDIRGNVQQVRQSLQNMPEFSPEMRTKIAVAMRSRDPRGTVGALLSGEAAKQLSPAQQDYLINTSLLIENAMAMRSVLGAGQGSEDLRSAITATIPSATTPTVGYASKQLDQFEKVLNRLERGVPNMPLRGGAPDSGNNSGNVTVTDPTGGVHTFPDAASANRFKKAAGIQ